MRDLKAIFAGNIAWRTGMGGVSRACGPKRIKAPARGDAHDDIEPIDDVIPSPPTAGQSAPGDSREQDWGWRKQRYGPVHRKTGEERAIYTPWEMFLRQFMTPRQQTAMDKERNVYFGTVSDGTDPRNQWVDGKRFYDHESPPGSEPWTAKYASNEFDAWPSGLAWLVRLALWPLELMLRAIRFLLRKPR